MRKETESLESDLQIWEVPSVSIMRTFGGERRLNLKTRGLEIDVLGYFYGGNWKFLYMLVINPCPGG